MVSTKLTVAGCTGSLYVAFGVTSVVTPVAAGAGDFTATAGGVVSTECAVKTGST